MKKTMFAIRIAKIVYGIRIILNKKKQWLIPQITLRKQVTGDIASGTYFALMFGFLKSILGLIGS